MSIQARPTPDVEVTTLTADEWDASVQRALERLNLTYAELAEQARRRDFTSIEARRLWLAIGDQEL